MKITIYGWSTRVSTKSEPLVNFSALKDCRGTSG
jgi:hypothetical protein